LCVPLRRSPFLDLRQLRAKHSRFSGMFKYFFGRYQIDAYKALICR